MLTENKTPDQKLYEAFRLGKGVLLTAYDVDCLLSGDNAVAVRVSNMACIEAGIPECGEDMIGNNPQTLPTWKRLLKELKS